MGCRDVFLTLRGGEEGCEARGGGPPFFVPLLQRFIAIVKEKEEKRERIKGVSYCLLRKRTSFSASHVR